MRRLVYKELKLAKDLRKALATGVLAIKFIKKTTGGSRIALATNDYQNFPIPAPESTRKHPPGLVVFWSIWDNGFRSFYTDNVQYAISVDKDDIGDLTLKRLHAFPKYFRPR